MTSWNDDSAGRRPSIELVASIDVTTDSASSLASAVDDCELFVLLLGGGIDPRVEDEYERAATRFRTTGQPIVFVYLGEGPASGKGTTKEEVDRLAHFLKHLEGRGQFYTRYARIDELTTHFRRQLDSLAAAGFFGAVIEKPTVDAPPPVVDPLLLAWRLVLDFKAEPELLLHLDASAFRAAVDKLASEARLPEKLAWPDKLALAHRHLESRHGGETPNALWVAWVNNLHAFKIGALGQPPEAATTSAEASTEGDDLAWVDGDRPAVEGEAPSKSGRPQRKK